MIESAPHSEKCPVCTGAGRPLLSLRGQPIYQHPVAPDATVPEPHKVDLSWLACSDCAHGWQPHFDNSLLERIYRSYYYTPAPGGIGVQFQQDFLATLEDFGVMGSKRVLLEIGSSSGDVLDALKTRTGASRAYAFEPNSENAVVARERGLDVREEFFTRASVRDASPDADLIYARHVIEHVFDFADFFAALDVVASPTADLVLETPSLDFHAERRTLDPFHIEHVHVFSLRSLARLAELHGWALQRAHVSSSGNLIAAFRKELPRQQVPAPALDGLQRAVDLQHAELQQRFAGQPLLFWGAGSSGVSLVSALGREPDIWTDGNPNKVGKRFVGLTRTIVSPESAFAQSRQLANPILVITSSFVDEILPRVRQLGWTGRVCSAAGKTL
jgi:hypothetical protein